MVTTGLEVVAHLQVGRFDHDAQRRIKRCEAAPYAQGVHLWGLAATMTATRPLISPLPAALGYCRCFSARANVKRRVYTHRVHELPWRLSVVGIAPALALALDPALALALALA